MTGSLRYRLQSAKRSLYYRFGLERFLFDSPPSKNLVLMFHNVVPVADPMLNPRNISLADFSFILDFIQRNFEVVSLETMLANSSKTGKIAITFDDGLINNLHYAASELARRKMPATYFISTPLIHGREILWPDELSFLLKHTGNEVSFHNKKFVRTYRSHFRDAVSGKKLEDELLESPQQDIDDLISSLRSNIKLQGIFHRENEDLWRVMKGEEIRLLAEIPGMRVGCHTITHRNMIHLSDDEVREELLESRKYLAFAISADVSMLAWPFGKYNARVGSVAQNAGFITQVGVTLNPVGEHNADVPFRLGVYNELRASEYCHQINSLLR